MDNGLALVFNIPAFLGTIFLFFCFWIYFKTFSTKIERILVSNFGDNLRDLYWLRKGKRFLKTLLKVTLLCFIFDFVIYFVFFYLFDEMSKDTIQKNEVMTITLCFLVIICWLYVVNWTIYLIIFIYNKQKNTHISLNIEHLSEFEEIKQYHLTNVGKNVFYNKQFDWKIKTYQKLIDKHQYNKIIKYSLVLIEMYALMIDNAHFNEINNNERYVKCVGEDKYLSRKNFLILINSYFNETIVVTKRQN